MAPGANAKKCSGDPQLTTVKFLNDFDTTALALSILPSDHGAVRSVMDEMITYTSEDGIIMVMMINL